MTKIGLTESSEIKGKIVKIDEKTAIRYKVVEEKIDLEALRQEKADLEAQLEMKEPSIEELAEYGKVTHPYFRTDRVSLQNRIDEINKLLE
jgi:hypothetical protein